MRRPSLLRRSGFAPRALLLCAIGILPTPVGCASHEFRERERVALRVTELERFLSARTAPEAIASLSSDFDSDDPLTGAVGRDRAALIDAIEFGLVLHRAVEVRNLRLDGDAITGSCVIEDDLLRLLDHPGSSVRITWTFDRRHRIAASRAEVPRGAPDLRNWLAPAIPWIRTHHPADLTWLFDGEELRRNARTALRWVELLTAWRSATGRPEISIEPPPFAVEPAS